MKDATKPSLFFGGMMLCTILAFAQQTAIPICHIPPGDPADAQTLYIGASALKAHLAHGDFSGDCWSGQNGGTVEDFQQGLQNNGTPVAQNRTDSSRALGAPDCNDADGGFVSLGFGGSIVLRMDGGILNIPGNDLRICETTFGNRTCAQYPEHARIYVSQDGQNWTDLGTICQDGEVDIAPLNWILYVKIVDETNPSAFGSQVVDGFDLDGVQRIMPSATRKALAEASLQEGGFLQPNPVGEMMHIHLGTSEKNGVVQIRISDIQGKLFQQSNIPIETEESEISINCKGLPRGQYILTVEGAGLRESRRIIKD